LKAPLTTYPQTAITGALTELGIERPIVGPLDQEGQQRNPTRGCTLTSSMGYCGQQTAITSRRGNQAKYLGVILDKKLLWTDNILDRTRKAAIDLFACKKAIGRKWGSPP